MNTSISPILRTEALNLYYGEKQALFEINLPINSHQVTALIGPSGCGKSSLLRCFNRMNDLILNSRIEGKILLGGDNLLNGYYDPTEIRYRIGMVFQKPNPFPKSIFENVAFGLKVNGQTKDLEKNVERALVKAGIWDEVKDRLNTSALTLSGGQQQRLCIARAIILNPEVLLLDEPCSALDPIATEKIEKLIQELTQEHTILMVTHNMQQAARVSQTTAFMLHGKLIEYGSTESIFHHPKLPETADYIQGRFG